MTVNRFYKQKFGAKVYKLALNAGCSCPTRNGTLGYGGCVFCNQSGSGDFVPDSTQPIQNQIETAKKLISKKLKNAENPKYIAYFQSFTNTYGNLNVLGNNWQNALACKDVVGIAVATRPDCLSDECLKLLGKISENHFTQVELGFQTSNEKSAKYIRRGFSNDVYFEAVKRLHAANKNIHIVTHVIFGLPGETKSDMTNTVSDVVKSGADGIKIACLYVLKNTDLQKDYEKGLFLPLEMQEYFDLLKQALKIIPQNMIIHRMTGDPPKKLLIAPKWSANKKIVLSKINEILRERL